MLFDGREYLVDQRPFDATGLCRGASNFVTLECRPMVGPRWVLGQVWKGIELRANAIIHPERHRKIADWPPERSHFELSGDFQRGQFRPKLSDF